jgi:hypothetical protein
MRIMDRHRHRPQVEALESWVPLSGAAGAMQGAVAGHGPAAIVTRQVQTFALNGTLHGGYLLNGLNPDVGGTYQVGVEGKMTPLGQAGASAKIQTAGFIAQGVATGAMTIAAPRGNLKLQLTGPVQSDPASLPATLSYTIIGGTRSYRGATGSGSIAITLDSSVLSNRFGLVSLRFVPGATVST